MRGHLNESQEKYNIITTSEGQQQSRRCISNRNIGRKKIENQINIEN